MKTKQILMAGALALSMVLSGGMLTGCSNSSTKDTKTTEVVKKKEVKTLGKKTKDSKSLKFTNITGKKITVFETKSSSEESFSDNLLDDGDAVKNKEERTLYYTVKENDKLDVKIGLQDQDKSFVFKDVDTTDVKKVDVSLKDDKVSLDVTKKDGSTATLTSSEDSVKTEEEKKDEQEVKQEEKKEEKKEETAKADTSNKSNSSESKKNNTASTTNTSSNKSNTGSSSKPSNNNSSNSSSSKPAEHTHNWVNVTKTVNHSAETHQEDVYEDRQVKVKDAWDEKVWVKTLNVCNQCGYSTTNGSAMDEHLLEYGHSSSSKDIYETVHHDAVYETQRVKVGTKTVTDKAAWTETVVTGQKCSFCGETKTN